MFEIPSRITASFTIHIDETGLRNPYLEAYQAKQQLLCAEENSQTELTGASPFSTLPPELILLIADYVLAKPDPYKGIYPRQATLAYTHLYSLVRTSRRFYAILYRTFVKSALHSRARVLHSAVVQTNIPLLKLVFHVYDSLGIPTYKWIHCRCGNYDNRCPTARARKREFSIGLEMRHYRALDHAVVMYGESRYKQGKEAMLRLEVTKMLIDKGAEIFRKCSYMFTQEYYWEVRAEPGRCPALWAVEGRWEVLVKLFAGIVLDKMKEGGQVVRTVEEMGLEECADLLVQEAKKWKRKRIETSAGCTG